ncbi:MAG: sigma-70 family RNA polymerase sigma factor [Planctomycetota bacterium]
MAQLKSGDRDALGPLFAKHAPYIKKVIGTRLGERIRRRVGVSDVVQATQLDAFERIDEFVEGEDLPFRWWLRKAAQRRLQRVIEQHLDTQKRDIRREVPLPDKSSLCIVAKLAGAGPTPSQHAVRREQAERVRRALAQLPDADREILLMRTVEGLPYDEIGYVLGIDPAAARKRRGRALLRLDRLLRDQGFAETSL